MLDLFVVCFPQLRTSGPSNPARSDLRIEGFAAEQREEGKKAQRVRVMLLTLHRLMLLA